LRLAGHILYDLQSVRDLPSDTNVSAGFLLALVTRGPYTFSQPLTLHNDGQLPVFIHGFTIDGIPCKRSAFRVSRMYWTGTTPISYFYYLVLIHFRLRCLNQSLNHRLLILCSMCFPLGHSFTSWGGVSSRGYSSILSSPSWK